MKSKNDVVLTRNAATIDETITVNATGWYLTLYTPTVIQQKLMKDHIVYKIPNKLSFMGRFIPSKIVHSTKWEFELGVGSGTVVPMLQ